MSKPIDVWLADVHPAYFVMVDGEVKERMFVQSGFPHLTWAQQCDIADAYRQVYNDFPELLG